MSEKHISFYKSCQSRYSGGSVTKSCPTLGIPPVCSPPGSSVHGVSHPGKNTGVGCHFLLQGIFLTQELNLGLPHCFPHSSVGKESACNAGDPGSIPGVGRSPGEGKGYPLQYSGLENSLASICVVHGVAKSWTRLSNFHILQVDWTEPPGTPEVFIFRRTSRSDNRWLNKDLLN